MIWNVFYTWLLVGGIALAILMVLYDDPDAADSRQLWMLLLAYCWPLLLAAFAVALMAWLAGLFVSRDPGRMPRK